MTGLDALLDTLRHLDRHLSAIVADDDWRGPLLADLRRVAADPALRPVADALEDALERFADEADDRFEAAIWAELAVAEEATT